MDKRRQQLISDNKKVAKNERKKADNYLYKVFITSAIVGILNWLFWYVHYIDTDIKYDIVFIYLPIVLGMVFFYFKVKVFVDYFWDATTFLDKLLTRSFLVIMGIMISYMSFGTIANVIFKLLLISSANDSNTEIHSYEVTKFIHSTSNRRNRINRFSTIHFQYSNDKEKVFKVENYAVLGEKSNHLRNVLVELNDREIKRKKLVLHTKKGFWDIQQVVDFGIK